MNRSLSRVLVSAVLLVALAVGGWAAEPAAPKKVAGIEGITEYRLDNGLRVLLFPDHSRPRVVVNMTVLVGSRHEGYGETGMAHLLEHMLFKGTPTHKDIDKLMQERGGQFNGTTWVDRTNYFEILPAKDDNLEFAIRLEADRLVNSLIRREDLASEMTVVRNEFESGENSPDYVLSQKMMAAAYEWHNYGKSTIGNRTDIERVPIENLQAFYKKHYQPDNVILTVAGQFDEAKALEYIRKYFGPIPKPERKLDATYTEEPPQDGERTVTLRRVGDVGIVSVMYHIPAGAHEDHAALQILNQLLTSQPSGRLYKALVESKKAESVSGSAFAWHDPGLLELTVKVRQENSLDDARDLLLKTLDEVRTKGVTEEEVERARKQLLKERELAAANSARIAIQLSEWAAQGDWRLYFLNRDRLEKVKPDDVKAVAAKYLEPNNRTLGLFITTKKPERVAIPNKPDLNTLVGDYKGRDAVVAGEEFDVAPDKIDARTQRTTLPEGLKVALLPKKTRGETVIVTLTLRYGDMDSLKGLNTAADLLADLMVRGTKRLTYQQLEDELDKHQANLSGSGDAGTATFAIETKRQHLPAVLGLLKEVLREPRLDAEEFEVLKRQRLAQYEQFRQEPTVIAVVKVIQKIQPYPKTDVRYTASIDEEIERVKGVKLDEIKKLYAEYLGAQAGELSIVGDFDAKEMQPLVTDAVKGWKAAKRYVRIPDEKRDGLPASKEVVKTPDKENACYAAGLTCPLGDFDAEHPALLMVNEILGGGSLASRLNDRLRQKDGLSYGASTEYSVDHRDKQATLLIMAIVNPENMAKVEKGVIEELDKLIKDGVTAEELDRVRKGFLEEQRTNRSSDSNLASVLSDTLEKDRTMAYYAELEKKLNALTPEDVNKAIRKYFDPKKLVIVTAGDFDKKKTPEKVK